MRVPNEKGEMGRFDAECEAICRKYDALATLLIVLTGDGKDGFSVTVRDPDLAAKVPRILRGVADDIENQSKAAKKN